jgi:DUF4097 and DUF4098 domain-containing protein YvlB
MIRTPGLVGFTVLAVLGAIAGAVGADAAEFDRTVPATRGTRLEVRLFGGEIVVHAWEKDAVRVRATHFRTDEIDLRTEGQTITVRARARMGSPHAIDFDINVPTWMAVDLAGTYLDVAVDGTEADVTAKTVRGDIRVKGGAGTVTLESIDGEVAVDGARGRIDLSSVNNGIRATALRGDVLADTVNGSVKLQEIAATTVEVSTTSGDILWDGTIADNGHYQFATHTGAIDVSLAEQANVTVNVRAFQGVFRASFPVNLPAGAASHKRFGFAIGSGAARLDLETFGGTISLRRPATSR